MCVRGRSQRYTDFGRVGIGRVVVPNEGEEGLGEVVGKVQGDGNRLEQYRLRRGELVGVRFR